MEIESVRYLYNGCPALNVLVTMKYIHIEDDRTMQNKVAADEVRPHI